MEKYNFIIEKKKVLRKGLNCDVINLTCKCSGENFKEIKRRMKKIRLIINGDIGAYSKGEELELEINKDLFVKKITQDSYGYSLSLNSKEMQSQSMLRKTNNIDVLTIQNVIRKNVNGVGPVLAKKITDAFGTDVFNILYENMDAIENGEYDKVKEIFQFLNSTQLHELIEALPQHDYLILLEQTLINYNIPHEHRNEIYVKYKDFSVSYLKTMPFKMKDILTPMQFRGYIKQINNKKQIARSAITYILEKELDNGNTAMSTAELIRLSNKLIKESFQTVSDNDLLGELSYFSQYRDVNNNDTMMCQLNYVARQEKVIADKLKQLNYETFVKDNVDVPDYFNQEQISAIKTTLNNNLSVITGGAGVGKTTVLKQIIETVLEEGEYHVILLAPTGKAAQRMSEAINNVDFVGQTIHKFSLMNSDDDDNNSFINFNKKTMVNGEVLDDDEAEELQKFYIIDESAMADTKIISKFLDIVNKEDKLLFVGDVQQLDSIGYGAVFKDIIESQEFPVSYLLTKVRQEDADADLSKLIDDIERKEINLRNYKNDGSVKFIDINKFSNAAIIKSLNKNLISGDYSTAQCLAPMNVGQLGNDEINDYIIDIDSKNNHKKIVTINEQNFTVGTPIIVTENNASLGVLNGQMGMVSNIIIEKIDEKLGGDLKNIELSGKKHRYTVDCIMSNGRVVSFVEGQSFYIKPAYSISIHKSQGSEYETVYLVLPKSSERMLSFNLIYTAITRAKKNVVIIGDEKQIQESLLRQEHRKTGLLHFLKYL